MKTLVVFSVAICFLVSPVLLGCEDADSSVVVPIERGQTDYLCIWLKLRDRKLFVAIDSGAPNTHFDKQSTKGLLAWQAAAEANFKTTDSAAVVKDLRIQGLEVSPLWVGAHDFSNINKARASQGDRPIDGVVGNDVLIRYRAVIDYGESKLYLRSPVLNGRDGGRGAKDKKQKG